MKQVPSSFSIWVLENPGPTCPLVLPRALPEPEGPKDEPRPEFQAYWPC